MDFEQKHNVCDLGSKITEMTQALDHLSKLVSGRQEFTLREIVAIDMVMTEVRRAVTIMSSSKV